MPNTNVVAKSSFSGASDTVRHGFAIARRETEHERIHRQQIWNDEAQEMVAEFEAAALHGELRYYSRAKDIR